MNSRTKIIRSIVSLGILVGIISNEGIAQSTPETHPNQTSQTTQFRPIEQPLSNKVLVTFAGISLISLELWWFLLSKPQSKKVTANEGIQEVTVLKDAKTIAEAQKPLTPMK